MVDVQDNVLRFFAIDHVLVYFVTIATIGAIFSLQFTKNRLAAGLRPDPLGELERSPRPHSHKIGGLLLRGGEGREGNGIGWEGRGGRGGERRGQERRVGGREERGKEGGKEGGKEKERGGEGEEGGI